MILVEDTEQILTPQRKYPTKSLGQYERHKNGDVKIRLPVDEDDYLQPKSSHPRKYMDLLEDPGKHSLCDRLGNTHFRKNHISITNLQITMLKLPLRNIQIKHITVSLILINVFF